MRKIERRQQALGVRNVAQHFRRFAKEHIEIHVHWLVAEMRIGDDEALLLSRPPDHRKWTTFPLADRGKAIPIVGTYRKHVALLRFVAPDLARGHSGLFRRELSQIERRAGTSTVDELRQRIGKTTGTDIVDRQDRVRRAQLPATVDHLLRATLHLGVAALHGIEIEIRGIGTGHHRRRGSATHSDQHSRSTEMYQQRAVGYRVLRGMIRADVADASGNHHWLVVAADLACDLLLEGAKIAKEIRTSEFVVERRGADWSFEHDGKCRRDAIRLSTLRFPRLRQSRQAQMRYRETGEPCLRLSAGSCRALIADLATRTRRSTRKRRNRCRMVVRLHFHQNVRRLGVRRVTARAIGVEAAHRRAFHDRCVVDICDHGAARACRMRVADHRKEASLLPDAIDDPIGVEDFMPAMLGVRLSKHRQLDIGRIAFHPAETRVEISDLVRRQRQPERRIRIVDRRAALSKKRN